MVIMDSSYSQKSLQEIWERINKYHFSYLELEDSPEKLEYRIKLEECIKEFLCNTSHTHKFYYPQTAEILQMSAKNKKDFSGYKAATGWNAIQLYAGNLLAQPWRKEYREIKTYSGFYKHQIQANLDGAEIMFEAMGYKHDGSGVLVLDGPICPDTVTHVSRDCLIAYVECQILKMIWEEVSSIFKITWLQVLEFRQNHLCSPEQSIKALKYQHQQRQYHQEHHTRSYSHGTADFLNNTQRTAMAPLQATSPMLPINHSFPPLTSMHHNIPISHQPIASPPFVYGSTCCANNYPPYIPVQPAYGNFVCPTVKPHFHTNGYTNYSNGYNTVPTQYYGVPTGQLIELENQNGVGYDVVDKPTHSKYRHTIAQETLPPIDLHQNKPRPEKNPPSRESDKDDSQFEDWDYVYRNLESQGYSKDLGERGDLLSPSVHEKRFSLNEKKVKSTNLDEAMNKLTVSDRPLKMTEALEKFEKEKKTQVDRKPERRSSQGSSYENITQEASKKMLAPKNISTTSNYAKTKTLPKEKITSKEPTIKQVQSKTLDIRKMKIDDKRIKETKPATYSKMDPNTWQCKACTYINETSKDICEMCSKTRKNSVSEPIMEIGGPECKKCTLVNPKDSKICQACGASLKNSATYI